VRQNTARIAQSLPSGALIDALSEVCGLSLNMPDAPTLDSFHRQVFGAGPLAGEPHTLDTSMNLLFLGWHA
jgi:hypothetical protein